MVRGGTNESINLIVLDNLLWRIWRNCEMVYKPFLIAPMDMMIEYTHEFITDVNMLFIS